MGTIIYKESEIEVVRTEDFAPSFIALINGQYYTNQTNDFDEQKCIKKAKRIIDRQK